MSNRFGNKDNEMLPSKDFSLFLFLPIELRCEMYKWLLHPGLAAILRIDNSVNQETLERKDIVLDFIKESHTYIDLSILRVSKQIYSEALPTLYRNVIFHPVADEDVLAAFFGPMSEFTRSKIRKLRLKPRPQRIHQTLGSKTLHSQLQRAPSWAPVCTMISGLFPNLVEVEIELHSLYGYELELGEQLDWVIRPLSYLKLARKTLVRVSNRATDCKTSEMVTKWNKLVSEADREGTEYLSSIERMKEGRDNWTNAYWRIKRAKRRVGISN
jgi:hypothetical protein